MTMDRLDSFLRSFIDRETCVLVLIEAIDKAIERVDLGSIQGT